jgi:hypothetical protein
VRTVEVTQGQLQQWIDRQFPLERRWLELFDVIVSAPRLTLRPQADRIATEFSISVTDRLGDDTHRGALVLEYGVRYEDSDASLRLVDPRIERMTLDEAPLPLQRQVDRFGVRLVEQALSDRAVYALRPKDIEAVRARGYRPGVIHVTASGLTITLLPANEAGALPGVANIAPLRTHRSPPWISSSSSKPPSWASSRGLPSSCRCPAPAT